MNNNNHLCLLFVILIGSVAFHCSLYYILNTTQYNFYDTDSWYTVRQIDRFVHGEDIQFDKLLDYPEGRTINWGVALPISYSFFVNKDDSTLTIFNKGGFLPPILSGIFVLLIYYLVTKLFSETIGFYSAILISVGTGIYFQNCLFGMIDHHLLESVLFTVMILCFLIAIKEKSDWWILPILISGIILFFTSVLWVFFYGIIGACVTLVFLLYVWKRNPIFGKLFLVSIMVIGVIFIWYFKYTYWLSLLLSWMDPITEVAFSDPTLLLIRFNILIPIFLLGILYIILTKKELPTLVLLLVSGVLVLLMLRFTRMECILTPIFLILSAYFIDKFFTKRAPEISTMIILSFLIFSIFFGTIIISGFAKTADNNSEWNSALLYLQEQNRGVVLSWWDYGHWIVAVSGQPPFTDPFQDNVIDAAKIFTNDTAPETAKYRYIIVTKNDYKFYDAMVWYSKSEVPYERSYLKKLIDGNVKNELVFKNTLIQIYRI
jgi:asparagine N-glycosylation enzyme membrane subunit Stt3